MPDLFVAEHKKTEKAEKIEEKKISSHPKQGKVRLFTSFRENPYGIVFRNQEEGEEIILFLKKHIATNIPWIIKASVAGVAPFFIALILGILNTSIPLPFNYILIFGVFYYFAIFGYVFLQFITWFFNISLITNQRVVDIDFSQLVFESVAATKLTQIEDVSYHQIGVLRSIFDYGDVSIQTAGAANNFISLAVPHPEKVVEILNDLIGENPNA